MNDNPDELKDHMALFLERGSKVLREYKSKDEFEDYLAVILTYSTVFFSKLGHDPRRVQEIALQNENTLWSQFHENLTLKKIKKEQESNIT